MYLNYKLELNFWWVIGCTPNFHFNIFFHIWPLFRLPLMRYAIIGETIKSAKCVFKKALRFIAAIILLYSNIYVVNLCILELIRFLPHLTLNYGFCLSNPLMSRYCHTTGLTYWVCRSSKPCWLVRYKTNSKNHAGIIMIITIRQNTFHLPYVYTATCEWATAIVTLISWFNYVINIIKIT